MQFSLYSSLPCPHNILDTKNDDSHTDISGSHACQISSGNFSPFNIIQTATRLYWLGCWPTCGYDPGTLLLRLSLLSSFHITAGWSFLYPLLSDDISLGDDTSAQILYDICNSTLYVINYHCHLSSMTNLLCFRCGCQTCFHDSKGGFFSAKAFLSHQLCWWIFSC